MIILHENVMNEISTKWALNKIANSKQARTGRDMVKLGATMSGTGLAGAGMMGSLTHTPTGKLASLALGAGTVAGGGYIASKGVEASGKATATTMKLFKHKVKMPAILAKKKLSNSAFGKKFSMA